MAVKTVVVLCACIALAFGAAIESRAKRQAQDAASEMMNNVGDAAKGIANRLQNAFNQTYQEERNSASDSFSSGKDQIRQITESGANLTKTAFDLGTVVPKFGKNLIIDDSK